MDNSCIKQEIPKEVISEINRKSMITGVFYLSKGSSDGLYVMEYMDYSRKIYKVISYGDEGIISFFKRYENFDFSASEFSEVHRFKRVIFLIEQLIEDVGLLNPSCLIKIGNKEFEDSNDLNLEDYESFIKSVIN